MVTAALPEQLVLNSSCEYSLSVLDFRPPLSCKDALQCEADWPCELRRFWIGLHPFVALIRWLLFYGTSSIVVVGTLLNSLSFYILLSSGLAHNGSGIYLLVLAVCDTGNLIFNFAVGVARAQSDAINNIFVENEWACRIHGVLVELFQLHSAWIVVGFTMERCLVVWYPFALRESRKYRSKIVIACIGFIFTLLSMSKLFITGFEKDSVFGYNGCQSQRYKWDRMVYVGIAFQTWIPTCIVFTCNCLMFFKLRRVKQNRDRLTAYQCPMAQKQRYSGQNRHRSTTPMLIAVSLAYLVLVFPVGIVQTVELYWNWYHKAQPVTRQAYIDWRMTKLLLKHIRSFCFAFYQFNFSINFFLYFISGVQFRLHLISQLQTLKMYFYSRESNLACGRPLQSSSVRKVVTTDQSLSSL